MSDLVSVATIAEIPPGGRKSVEVDGRAVLVVRIGDQFFCVEDLCTHDGQPLTDGPLVTANGATTIECPRHAARFDVRTGKPMCMPAVEPVATLDVVLQDGQVFVRPL